MRRAATTGGFLVLIGDSAVGKTRLLYEAALLELRDFRILAPDVGDGQLVNQLADLTTPPPKLIVWLDELHRFLDGPFLVAGSVPITAGAIRRLLDMPTAVVVVGTLWPEHLRQLRSVDSDSTSGQPGRPRYPLAVDVLDQRRIVEIGIQTFSQVERDHAALLSRTDPRLAEALDDGDYNVTEVLAGAPQIMRRYYAATNDQAAVLHAAVDARRLGVQGPLTAGLLDHAARGYLTHIRPNDGWSADVITELVRLERAAAPLLEIDDGEHRVVIGFTIADYLLQRASRMRRAERVPTLTWEALAHHVTDADDRRRMAKSANSRLLYGLAYPILTRLALEGDRDAAEEMVSMLTKRGLLDELKRQASSGPLAAAMQVLKADLQTQADAGDIIAEVRLTSLLVTLELLDELRSRVDERRGSNNLASAVGRSRLADMLVRRGEIVELRSRADAGDDKASKRFAELLIERGEIDELRSRADARDRPAAERYAALLAERGDVDELRSRADAGDWHARSRLVSHLKERNDVDELTRRADAGDIMAGHYLAELLWDQGEIDTLRRRAGAGDYAAKAKLAETGAEPDDSFADAREEARSLLRALIDRSDDRRLMAAGLELTEQHSRRDALWERVRAGDPDAGLELVDALAELGQLDHLWDQAEQGDQVSTSLINLVTSTGIIDVLRSEADSGARSSAIQLARLLSRLGLTDELRDRADGGDQHAAIELSHLLANGDRLEELRAEVDAGTWSAAEDWLALLVKRGRDAEADRARRLGLKPDGTIADC